jgi:hypothetical protein
MAHYDKETKTIRASKSFLCQPLCDNQLQTESGDFATRVDAFGQNYLIFFPSDDAKEILDCGRDERHGILLLCARITILLQM